VSYLPIEQYGIVGDLQSVALVGINRSIEWTDGIRGVTWRYPV